MGLQTKIKRLTAEEKEMLWMLLDFIEEQFTKTGENPWIKTPPDKVKMFSSFFRNDIFHLRGEFDNVLTGEKSTGYKMSQGAYNALVQLHKIEHPDLYHEVGQ